jgi:RND family efflux transporter MFP subunit
VQVADGSLLDLAMNLAPTDAARLHVGASVEVLGEGKNAAAIGDGTLTAVGAAVDSATRAVAVRASLRHSTRPLHVGETVPVRISVASRAKALVVPIAALVPDGESFKVFVVDERGIAHAREVEVDGRSDTLAEVVKGLKAGERIVTYGAYGMDDSVKVAPDTKPAAKAKPDEK